MLALVFFILTKQRWKVISITSQLHRCAACP